MSTGVYIPLILIPLFALAVAWKQLALSKDTTGGHGLTIGARRIERVPGVGPTGVGRDDQWNSVEFRIVARGPGTWYDVVGTMLREDRGEDVVVDRVARLDNTTGALTATVQVRTRDLDSSWFVVDWLAPHGAGVRRQAYRIRVRGAGTSPSRARRRPLPSGAAVSPILGDNPFAVPELEEWRWDRTWKARYWVWSLLPVGDGRTDATPRWTARIVRRWLQAGSWRTVHPREPVRTGWMPGVPDGTER